MMHTFEKLISGWRMNCCYWGLVQDDTLKKFWDQETSTTGFKVILLAPHRTFSGKNDYSVQLSFFFWGAWFGIILLVNWSASLSRKAAIPLGHQFSFWLNLQLCFNALLPWKGEGASHRSNAGDGFQPVGDAWILEKGYTRKVFGVHHVGLSLKKKKPTIPNNPPGIVLSS